MSDEKYKKYVTNSIVLLKKQAKAAKLEEDHPKKGSESYTQGVTMGYYSIFTLLKQEAFAFCLDQIELGLADIKPDIDLLGLHRNSDIDFGEDNWAIDTMSEEKVKGYLSDSIMLLKNQARDTKVDSKNSKESLDGYNKGSLMAYSSTFSVLKNQASVFGINQKEIGLSDIDPERDFL